MLKLEQWIKKAKKMDLCSPEIQSESARIKTLDVQTTEQVVTSLEQYLEDFPVHCKEVIEYLKSQSLPKIQNPKTPKPLLCDKIYLKQ